MMIFKKSLLGVVSQFNPERGFGFITEWVQEGRPRQWFFHVSAVQNHLVLAKDDIVVFELGPSPKRAREIIAVKVRLSKKADLPFQLRELFKSNKEVAAESAATPSTVKPAAEVIR